MSTQDAIVRNKPDENPVKQQASAGSATGKNYTRANIPVLGGAINVDASHLWRKLACVESTQIPPDNSRGNVFGVRGLMDVEIPGSQVHTPDNVVFQFSITNTANAQAVTPYVENTSQLEWRQIHLNTPDTFIEYMEELTNGGSPDNTYYGLDFKEWMQDCEDEEVKKNASLCHFVYNNDPQQSLSLQDQLVGVTAGPAKIANRRHGDPTESLTLWPSNIQTLADTQAPLDRPTPNKVTVFLPIKVPLFNGHVYWPALSVRPRLRFYFNTNDSIFDIDSSRGVNPLLASGVNNTLDGWNKSGWSHYNVARNQLNVDNYQLIMTGLVYGGSAQEQMNQIYNAGYTFPCLTPQRMIINFKGTGTLASPDDSAYQTLTSLQGMFAWIRYYAREQGAEIGAGTFHDFFEIVRTTLRNSGGKTIGFEKIPGQILCFDQEKRGKSQYCTNLSEKLNYNSNNKILEQIGTIAYNPQLPVDANNLLNGHPNSPNAARVLTDVYCDDIALAKEGANDGAENFDGNFTLQIALGRGVNDVSADPQSVDFTLHIHGWRYATYAQTARGTFEVRKH